MIVSGRRALPVWVWALGVALLTSACGGNSQPPSSGNPPGPVAPAPTPPSAATPEPPLSASCARLGDGDPKASCRADSPTFLAEVSDAIDTLRRERPELFDGNVVRNVGAYYVGIIRILDRRGICGGFDGEELAVKNTDDFSDQYDVLTARNEVRKYFVGTCYPAVFPLSRGPLHPPPAGCPLPSSRELACGRDEEAVFFADVTAAVEDTLKGQPELFDFAQKSPGTDWPAIRDFDAYYRAVIGRLTAKGYCAIFDGEEVQVKKANERSEHYDVNLADRYVRLGAGIYRGSCYPAAF
jgi:hypothetical protein